MAGTHPPCGIRSRAFLRSRPPPPWIPRHWLSLASFGSWITAPRSFSTWPGLLHRGRIIPSERLPCATFFEISRWKSYLLASDTYSSEKSLANFSCWFSPGGRNFQQTGLGKKGKGARRCGATRFFKRISRVPRRLRVFVSVGSCKFVLEVLETHDETEQRGKSKGERLAVAGGWTKLWRGEGGRRKGRWRKRNKTASILWSGIHRLQRMLVSLF